jgi:hypothetical protein
MEAGRVLKRCIDWDWMGQLKIKDEEDNIQNENRRTNHSTPEANSAQEPQATAWERDI